MTPAGVLVKPVKADFVGGKYVMDYMSFDETKPALVLYLVENMDDYLMSAVRCLPPGELAEGTHHII